MLLDSNIIIYASQPGHQSLRDFIARHSPLVSVISYVEVLGYHRLTEQEKLLFEEFFANVKDFDWIAGLSILNPFED